MQRFGKTIATEKGEEGTTPQPPPAEEKEEATLQATASGGEGRKHFFREGCQNGDKSGDLPTHKQLQTFRGTKRCTL